MSLGVMYFLYAVSLLGVFSFGYWIRDRISDDVDTWESKVKQWRDGYFHERELKAEAIKRCETLEKQLNQIEEILNAN